MWDCRDLRVKSMTEPQRMVAVGAVAAEASRIAAPVGWSRAVALSRAVLSSRSPHTDALGSVPISNLPTVGLADSLDARVNDPSASCAVRRGDDFAVARLVGEAVADSKLHREDLGVGR